MEEWEQFAADRGARLTAADDELEPLVAAGLARWGSPQWWSEIVDGASVLWIEIFEREAPGSDYSAALAEFRESMGESLAQTMNPDDANAGQLALVTKYVGTATVNDATYRAARATRAMGMRWVSMRDEDVRLSHRRADGQIVSVGGTFAVGEARLRFPGDPLGPLNEIMNCRCVLFPVRREAAMATTLATEPQIEDEETPVEPVLPDDADDEDDLLPAEIPWHGVLAPMGVPSGDGRMFAEDALTNRELPLPLMYQRASSEGHGGSVRVGRIDRIEYRDGMAYGHGVLLTRIEEANEVIDGIVDGAIRGLSVDVDDVHEVIQEIEIPEDATPAEMAEIGQNQVSTFDRARIMGVTVVAFPAFPQAYIALGEDDADEALVASGCNCVDGYVSEEPWDGSASRFTDEEWFRSTLIHTNGDSRVKSDNKLPILEPDGELSRAAVHAAAARINQTDATPEQISRAKAALRGAYEDLGEDPPEAITAAAFSDPWMKDQEFEEFVPGTRDGPGWLTHPEDTQRLRNYWTRGKGAAKIRWGQPGDFNRCRRQLAKYVNPLFLAGTCANLHKVAIGVWPGRERGNHSITASGEMAPAFTIVASASALPGEWFRDPELTGPTPLTITDEGRVYGHVAQWGVCHIGIPGVCTAPPSSPSDYSFFRVGVVNTTDGPVHVGQITMDTGHANPRLGMRPAAAHYDNTGSVVADIAVGEDEFGIWMAGAIRPGVDEEAIFRLRASGKVSGDWRPVGTEDYELIGVLAVNIPGYPIPRTSLAASGERQLSLIAAGIVTGGEIEADNLDQIADLVATRLEQRQARKARVTAALEKAAPLREKIAARKSERFQKAKQILERR